MSVKPTTTMITALFDDPVDAHRAYDRLATLGYNSNDISVLVSDKVAPLFHAVQHDDNIEAKDQPGKGALATGFAGATLGAGLAAALAAGASVVLAGLGLVTAGPLGAALAGSIPGALVGGLVGGLVGFGFPEQQAQAYESAIKQGAVALGVALKQPVDLASVQAIFDAQHAREVTQV